MHQRQATIVAGLGFGDEGKGTMTDYVAQTSHVSAVVRFNGGPQARHGVVTPDGRHHSFSQFGSGSFKPGVRTHLSRFMLVDPLEMLVEANALHQVYCRRVYELLSVDEDAIVITPFHKDANFIRERARGTNTHGSCGMGIGETMHMSLTRPDLTIRAGELKDLHSLRNKLRKIQEFMQAEFADDEVYGEIKSMRAEITHEPCFSKGASEHWAEVLHGAAQLITVVDGDHLRTLARMGSLVFEGAQGVLLDEWYGFHPHTTWSTTTFSNAGTLLREIDYNERVERIGVFRAYLTRHGEGPFVTEDEALTKFLPDADNDDHGPQGKFRVGWFDLVMARYALAVSGGVDSLAITHLDRFNLIEGKRKIAVAYSTKEGRQLEDLTVKANRKDLVFQEKMTAFLKTAIPVYKAAPEGDSSGNYLAMIEKELGVPIRYTSQGPTFLDKQVRSSVMSKVA